MFDVRFVPNITHIPVAVNRYDPVHSSLFKVTMGVPLIIAGEFNIEEMDLISSQILTVEGLDTLQKPISTYTKRYLGVETIGVKPSFDSTTAQFSITFNLNLRNISDNYVFKLFKEWQDVIYNISVGLQTIKYYYMSEYLVIYEANRDGTIWRQINFKNVIPTNVSGLNTLDYTSNDALVLTVNFVAEYWDEIIA